MRYLRGRWTQGCLAIATVLFVVAGIAASEGLKVASLPWPPWAAAGLMATVPALVGILKALADASVQTSVKRSARAAELKQRRVELVQAVTGTQRVLPRVRNMTDRALLGIHPAIPLPPDSDPKLSAEFPTYVPRDIDPDLRSWLTSRLHTGGFAILVGPAASGKSRCLHEALMDLVPNWKLLLAVNGQEVNEIVATGTNLSHTVFWLDDVENFFGAKGLTVSTVRRILADSHRPVLLVGTVWPDRFDILTRTSHNEDNDKFGRDAQEILSRFATRFDLISEFSLEEQDRARILSEHDPRLTEALRGTAAANFTQTLAAAPELIRRWSNPANPYGAAVITAAVVTRLCGHPEPIPARTLQALAENVLTTQERAAAEKDWFLAALTWACEPVRGEVAPLTAYAKSVGMVDGYCISDVLIQKASSDSSPFRDALTEEAWNLVVDHSQPKACAEIAFSAYYNSHLVGIAVRAMRKARPNEKSPEMMTILGHWLEQSDLPEAEKWYRRAANAGHAHAMEHLGVFLRTREPVEAERWLRRAAEAHDTQAMHRLGLDLADRNPTEAEYFLRKASSSGDIDALVSLGALLVEQEPLEAIALWQKAAEEGNSKAMQCLGLFYGPNNRSESIKWLRLAADSGREECRCILSELLTEEDPESAQKLWIEAAEGYDEHAMFHLGVILFSKKPDEAEIWLQRAADAGDPKAMLWLGRLILERSPDKAETLWHQAANADDPEAMFSLSVLLHDREPEQSRSLLERASAAGHARSMTNLGAILLDQGEDEAAEKLFHSAVEAGEGCAMANLGEISLMKTDMKQAEEWFRKAVEAGYFDAAPRLGIALFELGREEEAAEFLQRASAEDLSATTTLAIIFSNQGRKDEAETMFRRAASTGDPQAALNLGIFLAKKGEISNAEEWLRQAAEADLVDAMVYLAEILNDRGHSKESNAWSRRAELLSDSNNNSPGASGTG